MPGFSAPADSPPSFQYLKVKDASPGYVRTRFAHLFSPPQTISDPALGDNIENSENITLLKTWIKKSLLVDMFLKLLSCMEVPLVLEGL